MVQETVRYSDSVVETVQSLVEEGTFNHKSEFYRFATELLLDQLDEEYEPEMVSYDALSEATQQSTHSTSDQPDRSMFYQSAIVVRRHARCEEITAAEEHIDRHYPPERGEYLLLEALLDYYSNMDD
jgi:Arc/MetJ-type ribon-helix-helix transcriptional regulator